MFKKKPTVKLLAPLRSTDRRKLANQLVETFSPTSSSTDTDVTVRNRILPPNARSAKLSTTSGPELKPVSGTLYVGGDVSGEPSSQPLWVQIGDEGPFPTVYTLWRNAGLLPILLTHDDVLARMRDGADLMVPGLIGPPFPGGAKAGRFVGIASEHNPSVPLVVGVCEVDVCDVVEVAGGHGRAVRGVHWVGDEIFKMGNGEVPDVVVSEQEVEVDVEVGDGEGGGVALDDVGAVPDEDGEREKKEDFRELSTTEIDDAFHSAAIFGIHDFYSTGKSSSLDLPLTSSQFISTLVVPYLPPASSFPPHNLLQNTAPHPSLQLKKSSYKSAAKFLKALDKGVLVKIKNRNGGEVVVLDVNWESDVVAGFTPYPLPEAPKEKKGATATNEGPQGSAGILKVVELFRPNGKAVVIFQAAGAAPKEFYTASAVKSVLTTYLEGESLINPTNKRLANLNPQLSSLPHLKDHTGTTIDRSVLADMLLASCSQFYRVVNQSSSSSDQEAAKPKPGPPPAVSVAIETRQGKKSVTRVSGLEPFGIDAKTAAEHLQKVCAGSASVAQLKGSSPKTPVMEIVLQGSQRKAVENYLKTRGVAGKCVIVVDKTGGKKK